MSADNYYIASQLFQSNWTFTIWRYDKRHFHQYLSFSDFWDGFAIGENHFLHHNPVTDHRRTFTILPLTHREVIFIFNTSTGHNLPGYCSSLISPCNLSHQHPQCCDERSESTLVLECKCHSFHHYTVRFMQKLISGNLGKLMEPLMHYTNEN